MLYHQNTLSWYLTIRRAFRACYILHQEASKSLSSERVCAVSREWAKITARHLHKTSCLQRTASGFLDLGASASGICSHEIQSRFLFCWDIDTGGSRGSLCLRVYFALQYLGVWGCTFYHRQDCFSVNKNLRLALQVAVIAWEVIWPLVRKWVSEVRWVYWFTFFFLWMSHSQK